MSRAAPARPDQPEKLLSPALKGHLAMLCFSALVAGSFSLGGRVANDIDPMALTALRFALTAAILAGIALASGGFRRADLRSPWRYLLLGAVFAGYFVLMFEGLKTAPPVSAAAVFTLTPLMAAGFGWLLLRERSGRRILIALGIGGLGALWVIFRGDAGALMALDIGRGEAVYLIGCALHALYIPLVRMLNRGESVAVFSFGTMIAGAGVLLLLGWSQIAATPWGALPALVWIALGYLVVFAGTSTLLLLQYASFRLPSAKVMAYTYLTPSWVVLWEVALTGAWPGEWLLIGLALTAVALLLLLKRREAIKMETW